MRHWRDILNVPPERDLQFATFILICIVALFFIWFDVMMALRYFS